MPGQGPASDWTECGSSAPPAVVGTEGGGGGSAGHSFYQNSKGTDEIHIMPLPTERIKDGHKVDSNTAKLQELWKTPQIQTIHIPKSMMDASFLKEVQGIEPTTLYMGTRRSATELHNSRYFGSNAPSLRKLNDMTTKMPEKSTILEVVTQPPKDSTQHPDLTTGQKRYLCSIAKLYNANYLRTLMKRQYMHVIQRSSQKPGVLTHHKSRLSSRYSQKQHYPCTTWRHQLEREDLGPSNITAASAPEMIIQHSLWRPVRNKGGLKTGYASKTRCKSLKIFRRPSRLFMQPDLSGQNICTIKNHHEVSTLIGNQYKSTWRQNNLHL
ncbi:protein FAM216A isoform X3 [Dasypus novemcinctus]|uniref:protein FAM216A isoform X3 n=1 Tax=Dasypus novemcinctus TaxID=9361 RepID=UPI000328F80F|nr:protein FAM216A isoform X3 [Dasypus novemcinctus]